MDDLEKLTLKELKERCKEMGLLLTGKKSELIERLKNPDDFKKKRKRDSFENELKLNIINNNNEISQKTTPSRNKTPKRPNKLQKFEEPIEVEQNINIDIIENKFQQLLGQNSQKVSRCLKSGVQKGYIPLDFDLETILCESPCIYCPQRRIVARIKDIIFQPDVAGTDFEDGGEEATLKCPDCAVGIYVTNICEGHPNFDSGKFHNHCEKCKIYGKCIGDYRRTHCSVCNNHFFKLNENSNPGDTCDECKLKNNSQSDFLTGLLRKIADSNNLK